MFPHATDSFCTYICKDCSVTKMHRVTHTEKDWYVAIWENGGDVVHILIYCIRKFAIATTLYNLERFHGRQYFSQQTLCDFMKSEMVQLLPRKNCSMYK